MTRLAFDAILLWMVEARLQTGQSRDEVTHETA
jgi:hypothetical protein